MKQKTQGKSPWVQDFTLVAAQPADSLDSVALRLLITQDLPCEKRHLSHMARPVSFGVCLFHNTAHFPKSFSFPYKYALLSRAFQG